MSTLAHDVSPAQPAPSRFWWMVLGAVAAGQLCAFWMLCTQQVRSAEARRDEAVMQQMAMSDCLQYIPGSTIASCTTRLGLATASRPADADPADGATRVSYSIR